ncbi:pseudomurein-binding repeat-containing protein [Methanobacterium sp. ACI-7]|uniref:pseudomurein-binding repeat-containing protein n=1 Tax=unclassified Methanobacterium TaxID=2627676 RepID=UPI0039C40FA0
MAMSTISGSFATADTQQTAENIQVPALIEQNTAKNQDSVDIAKSSSNQNLVQNTESTSEITSDVSVTDTTQTTTEDSKSVDQNAQITTQETTPSADSSSENSAEISSTNTVLNQTIQSTVNTQEEPQAAAGENYTNIRGIWLKAEDAGNITVSELKSANITDIFVKTNLISTPTYQTVLGSIITKFQNSGIRIHAWITCFKDADGNWINPANATQRTFLLNSITNMVKNYAVDGIHLDYIRYSGVGDNAAYNYANGTETITSFVSSVKQVLLLNRPKTALSASLMPEGANNARYYGQDYGQLANYLDFLVPMIYKGNYGQNTTWIGTTTKYIVDHAIDANGVKKPVIAGLQTYISDYDTTKLTANELYQDIKAATDNGASGYALFRYGMVDQDFLKVPSFTIAEIKDAAARIKSYIETNKRLPNFVTIATKQVTMSQFLKLMTASVLQLNSGITKPITLQNIQSPSDSTGTFTKGTMSKSGYLDLANRLNTFMNANGHAPNYATTSLGKMPYESLVYMFSKILGFHNSNNRFASYVSMDPAVKVAPPIVSEITIPTFTFDQITAAAKNVKSYVENNYDLPKYVTVGTTQVSMSDFLRLLVIGTIEIRDGVKAPISLKTVNGPAIPSENLTNGTMGQSDYLDLAKRLKAFIDANGSIPNHATTPLGEMKFESIVYTFSKILGFYNTNSRLPDYVSVDPWSKVSAPAQMEVPAELQSYLAATANCQVNDPRIKALAASITAGKTTAYGKAVAIFNWVRDNLSYSFYYNTKYGAVGALNARTGNCVDTSHLVIALSRAAGLPAKYVHGTCQFTSGSWYGHVWARIWVDGKWYAADATSSRNTFGVVNNWNTATYTLKGTYASLPF